jgi:hypothetical protein
MTSCWKKKKEKKKEKEGGEKKSQAKKQKKHLTIKVMRSLGRGPTRRRGTKRGKDKRKRRKGPPKKKEKRKGHLSGYLAHTEHILTPSLINYYYN